MRLRNIALLGVLVGGTAGAHSASDAYLTLTAEKSGNTRVLHGQWDIALRDLDFVLNLDEDGRGRLTWGEVRRHQVQIDAYAYQYLRFSAGSAQPCVLKPLKQMLDQHADGAYAVLLFDVTCTGGAKKLSLDYSLFFGIDPSHRAFVVMRSDADIATAVLSPQNAKIDLN